MNTIYFRYNKYSPYVLYFLLIIGIATGLLLDTWLLNIFLGKDPLTPFLEKYSQIVVLFIFASIPISMLIPTFFAYRFWGKEDEEASIRFFSDHAILYYRNKEILMNKGEIKVIFLKPQAVLYLTYKLKTPQAELLFCSSTVEKKEKKKKISSLAIAMEKLEFFEKEKEKRDIKESFYELKIILEKTTPEIFDSSPYYVDYTSLVTIEEGGFTTCLIRDRKNPVHVVGDLQIDISGLDKNEALTENNLRKQSIQAVIELDEEIALD